MAVMAVMAVQLLPRSRSVGVAPERPCLGGFLGTFLTTKFRNPCRNINDAPALLTGLLLRFSRLVRVISNNNHAITLVLV